MSVRIMCPDGGTCHHGCAERDGRCFRVQTCEPLSIAGFPGDEWPESVRALHAPESPSEWAIRLAKKRRLAQERKDVTHEELDIRAVNSAIGSLTRALMDVERRLDRDVRTIDAGGDWTLLDVLEQFHARLKLLERDAHMHGPSGEIARRHPLSADDPVVLWPAAKPE
jgi:hypothetical protein